ncbi:putative VIER F-box protein 1 [Datura stramonium]|uniref:VIER F-box protein 1 n=1 Tax=Datura stramonium TaxID=4076 RepID=A0ABS8Y801_DATST|nr:putative VIER F-box protein 1 [Datura stramonium]
MGNQLPPLRSSITSIFFKTEPRSQRYLTPMKESDDVIDMFEVGQFDYSSTIPDECLACIFQSLSSGLVQFTKLALKCDRRSTSIGDDALLIISLRCRNLTRLKLRTCREITDARRSGFAKNCKEFEKAVVVDRVPSRAIGSGIAAASLRVYLLKGSTMDSVLDTTLSDQKNLRTLKLFPLLRRLG